MEAPIVEIFHSIQGEGLFVGTPCIFVRLAGCPLSCSFCDTDKEAKRTLQDYQIVEEVEHLPNTDIVVLTGGEPSMYSVNALAYKIKQAGYSVHVETNGYKPLRTTYVDWVSLSPKKGLIPLQDKPADEVKWLVPEWSLEEIQRLKGLGKIHFVQPVNFKDLLWDDHTKLCLEYQKLDPSLRLSVQLHKVLGVK